MLLAICTAQVKKKESENENEKKKYGHEKFASRGFKPGPFEYFRTKTEHLYPLEHLFKRWQFMFKRRTYSFSMVTEFSRMTFSVSA